MTKRLFAFLLFVCCRIAIAQDGGLTHEQVCAARAALVGSMAQERDNGMTKAALKKKISTNQVTRKMGHWVEIVYGEAKDVSPSDLSVLVNYSCVKNSN